MKPDWLRRLLAPEDEDGGSADDVVEHEFDEPEEATVAAKAPDPELVKLQEQVATLTRRTEQAEQDASFWAGRAQRGERVAAEEPEEVDEPVTAARVITDEKPEALLDDVTNRGLAALQDRGIITKADLDVALAKIKGETASAIAATRKDAEFGLQVADEFPDFAEESRKIDEAKNSGTRYVPKDPHFVRTGQIFRQAVAMDKSLANSPSALMMAARQAKSELQAQGKWDKGEGVRQPARPTQDTRRERINRLNPSRVPTSEADGDDTGSFTTEQMQVMKHLKVKPEVFRKQASKPRSGARV